MTPGPVDAFGVRFQNPVLLAAGTAGFGREVAGVIALDALGGVVTKAVSHLNTPLLNNHSRFFHSNQNG